MYCFGGYDGTSRLNDFIEFRFGPGRPNPSPSPHHIPRRLICWLSLHVRLLTPLPWLVYVAAGVAACEIPQSTLLADLKGFVNCETLSDITFVVEGQKIFAHKILCMRCTFFRALLTGDMRESREKEVRTMPQPSIAYLHRDRGCPPSFLSGILIVLLFDVCVRRW
jgi:hypothetical protein